MRPKDDVIAAHCQIAFCVIEPEVVKGDVGDEGFAVEGFRFADHVKASIKAIGVRLSVDSGCEHSHSEVAGAGNLTGSVAV